MYLCHRSWLQSKPRNDYTVTSRGVKKGPLLDLDRCRAQSDNWKIEKRAKPYGDIQNLTTRYDHFLNLMSPSTLISLLS